MELTHIDESGRAKMVDVGAKDQTERVAVAEGKIVMLPQTFEMIREGKSKKGDVFAVAQVAGIMAAKKTSEIIPMCHPIMITGISMSFTPIEDETNSESATVRITARVSCTGQTGVEMEALHAVSAAALTVYDMCKAVDRGMRIEGIRLLEKSGGKSGIYKVDQRDR